MTCCSALLRFAAVFAGSAALALVGGCDSTRSVAVDCPDILRINVSPRDTVIPIGARLQPKVSVAAGCDQNAELSLTLVSTDPATVRVTPILPFLEARGAGVATVSITDTRFGHLGGITVTVMLPP